MLSSLYCRNTVNYINKLQTFYRPLSKNAKHTNFVCFKSSHSSFNNTFKVKNTREYNQQIKADELYVNTNIKNNVMLYKYENPRYFGTFKIFCFGWTFFAAIISYYTFDSKFIVTWTKDISWMDYFHENGMNLMYFTYAIIIGPSAFLLLYTVNKKFIKYIILHKGGTDVSLVTHHLFKRQEIITFPVDKVAAIISRKHMKDYMPIKVKGKKLYYLLDADGMFLNRELFDHTVGTRKW